jgi:hypothetical protein
MFLDKDLFLFQLLHQMHHTPINLIERLEFQIIMIIPNYQGWGSQLGVLIIIITTHSSFLQIRPIYTIYDPVQLNNIAFLVHLDQLDYLSIGQV